MSKPTYISEAAATISDTLDRRMGTVNLPKFQNPYVTLLHSARGRQVSRTSDDPKMSSHPKDNSHPLTTTVDEVKYEIKGEYESGEAGKKIVHLSPKKYEGIGPTTREGFPIGLKSEVKEDKHSDWYKKVYKTLHRQDSPDDYYKVSYKRKGIGQHGGYTSEPELESQFKYATLDRRQLKKPGFDPMPRNSSESLAARYYRDTYRNQPGRIEDYEPGYSSISSKEAKMRWDEVLEVFDLQEEREKQVKPKSNMQHALDRELSGYDSDSTLVFRRVGEGGSTNPGESKIHYRELQKGGEIPFKGLRKPAPEKPKDDGEERKFRDITRPVTLSQEILSHVTEHYPLDNFDNAYQHDCAELNDPFYYPKSSSPSLSQTSPRTCYSAIASEMGSERSSSPERFAKNNNFLLVLAPDPRKSLPDPDSESTGSQTSVRTVINRDVNSKITFFEKQAFRRHASRSPSPRRTHHQSVTNLVNSYEQLYHQHSRSQGDLRQYDKSPLPQTSPRGVSSSQSKSCIDLAWTYSNEDLREAQRTCTSYYFMPHYVPERSVSTIELHREKSMTCFGGNKENGHSLSKSTDFWDPSRSSTLPRSVTGRKLAASTADCRMDDRTKYWRTYLLKVRTGEVQKLREKFESLEYLVIPGAANFSGRRVQSSPNVSRTYASTEHLSRSPKPLDTSDSNRLKRKHQDTKTYRKACTLPRTLRPRETKSQSPERREAQFGEGGLRKIQSMPNVESRLLQRVQTGDVEKLKTKFEHVLQTDGRVSLLGQMYTSTPELRELDPCFSLASRCQRLEFQKSKVKHHSSPDPKKKVDFSINVGESANAPHLPVYSQNFPSPKTYQTSIHRPIIRQSSKESVYRSDMTWSGLTKQHESTSAQNQTLTMRQASPHRYLEGEVNIHYRSPTRILEKEYIDEEELRNKQQEAMRRFYEEEKRKKQMMEIDDLERRRHHDFITPLQNSPINLQRYDNMFEDVTSTRSRDRTPDPKVVAKALYNFTAQTARELTFKKGDIIYVRRQVDKNWYEGEHNAMVGIFPVSYVEIVPYDGVRNQSKTYKEGQARAKYNFIAQTPTEMSLVKGEVVLLVRRLDTNWYEGRIGSRKGIFPASYVETLIEPASECTGSTHPSKSANPVMMNGSVKTNIIKSSSSPYSSSISTSTLTSSRGPLSQNLHIETKSEPMRYRVLYNYRPRNEDEVELKEGDTVLVVEKCDDGWYVGSSQRTGLFGTFPGNYVQRM